MSYNPNIQRIMLIFPPSTSVAAFEPMVPPPMGIAYLAAVLRDAGYEVSLLDAVAEDAYQEEPITDDISRFGLTYDQIMDRIKKWQPDLVGLSSIFSNQWPAVRELSKRLKALDPDRIIMTGGAHPSFMSERCMNDAPIDFIIRGEAEHSLVELLARLREERPVDDVDGLVWREGEAIRANPKTGFIQDLDSLPFPAHDLLDTEQYFKLALPMGYTFLSPRNLPVMTSRGCPCQCTFCSSTNLWGKHHRTRSVGNVLAELDWLVEKFKIEEIKFEDDNLTADRKRARELFKGMAERPWHLHWNTPNGIAVWTLDDEMLGLMKKSGCFEITLAIESGDQEVLSKLVKKPLKLEKVREVNKLAEKHGIVRIAYFIIGFPGETREQIMRTVRFARELRLDFWAIFIYNPLPGSELFEECIKKGYITEESFFESGNLYFSSVIDSDEWTSAELESIISWEWLQTYFALFRHPYLLLRRWFIILRYRPNLLMFFISRTRRSIKLRAKKMFKTDPSPSK